MIKTFIIDLANRIVIGAIGVIGLIFQAGPGVSDTVPAIRFNNSAGRMTYEARINGNVRSSGTLVHRGAIGSALLANCDSIDGTSTGMLVCGSDATGGGAGTSVNTGAILDAGNSRFVNVSGDTMTGALKVRANLSGSTLNADNLVSCDTIDTNASGRLACGTDNTGTDSADDLSDNTTTQLAEGTNLYYTTDRADSRYVNTSGDTMTGKLLINAGLDGLEVIGTASGRVLHAQDQLQSSGSLIVEGTSYFTGNATLNALLSFVGYSASPQLTAGDTTTGIHFDGPGIVSFHNGGTQTMLLSSTNNVGIGTGTPDTKLEVVGTASGRVVHAQDQLRSSGSLVIEGAVTLAGVPSCAFLQSSSAGALSCNTSIDDTEMTAEDFGDWTCTAGEDGCTVDADSIALTTDTTGNYAAGDAEAGAALTGDSATSFFSAGTLEIGIGGTGFSSCTDGGMITGNGSAALTCNAILSDDQVYIGDGTTEPTATTLPSCSAAGDTLNYNAGTNAWACGTDADTTYTAGQGLTLVGTAFSLSSSFSGSSLEIMGTSSGRILHAQDSLRSSGSLLVEGLTILQNTVRITGLNCTGNTNGGAITAAADGTLSCTDDDSGGASGISDYYVRTQGDTMTGGLLIVSGGAGAQTIDSGLLLEIAGTGSGYTLHAQNLLRSSGALAIEGGFYQDGLADCDNAGEKPVYNFATGKWTCGTDDDVPESGDFAAAGDLDTDGTITDGVIDKADFTISTDYGEISTDGSSNLTIDADVIGQSEVTGNALDFAELQDTLDLDATTEINLGANAFNIDLDSTGDFSILDAGNGIHRFYDTGLVEFNISNAATADFNVYDSTAGDLIFADVSTSKLGIGTRVPETKLEVIGTMSGSDLSRGGREIHSQKHVAVILFGSGTSVTAGRQRAMTPLGFSGSLVRVEALHGEAGTGLATYDVNINGVTRLSTKLTVDANERCSTPMGTSCTDTAAAPPVITQPRFSAHEILTIDVDSIVGTAPKQATIFLYFEPDGDGYTDY